MAYFANGSEGSCYESQYCSRCVHNREPEDNGGCPVLFLHLLWNYEQRDGTKAEALGLFIPRTGIHNEQCRMFWEKTETLD